MSLISLKQIHIYAIPAYIEDRDDECKKEYRKVVFPNITHLKVGVFTLLQALNVRGLQETGI
jgi:hypothetical protein